MILEPMREALENLRGCTDCTKDGVCSNCGECCSDYLPISQDEIRRIKRYIKQHKIVEHHNFVLLNELAADVTCPFRNEVKRQCDIYDVRPEICRAFKCDYEKEQIDLTKKVFHQKNEIVSMRKTFFDDTSAELLLRKILLGFEP